MVRRSSRANKGRHSQREAEVEVQLRDEIQLLSESEDEAPSSKKQRTSTSVGEDEYLEESDKEHDEDVEEINDEDEEHTPEDEPEEVEEEYDEIELTPIGKKVSKFAAGRSRRSAIKVSSTKPQEQARNTRSMSEEAGSVKCTPCGANDLNYKQMEDKYGVDMISCDVCNTWQHYSCMNITRPPKRYKCHECSKEAEDNQKTVILEKRRKESTKKADNSNKFLELDDSQLRQIASTFYNTLFPKLPEDLGDSVTKENFSHQWAVGLVKAIHSNFPKDQHTTKSRAVLVLIKNPDVLSKISSKAITYDQLVSLRPEEVVKGLNEIAEKVKQESIKRAVLKANEAPRVRRTHKGEEIVEDHSRDHRAEDTQVNIVSRSVDHRIFHKDPKSLPSKKSDDDKTSSVGLIVEVSENGESNGKGNSGTYSYSADVLNDDSDFEEIQEGDVDKAAFEKEGSNALDNDDDMDKIIGTNNSSPNPKSILKGSDTPSSTPPQPPSEPVKSTHVWRGPLLFPEFASFTALYEFLTATGYKEPVNAKTIKNHNRFIDASKKIFTRQEYNIQGRLDRSMADPYLSKIKSTRDFFIFQIHNENNPSDYEKLFNYFFEHRKVGVLSGKPSNAKDAYLFALKGEVPSYFNGLHNMKQEGLFAVYVMRRPETAVFIPPVVQSPPRKVSNPVNSVPHKPASDLDSILSSLYQPSETTSLMSIHEFNNLIAKTGLSVNLSNEQQTKIYNMVEANPSLKENPAALGEVLKQFSN